MLDLNRWRRLRPGDCAAFSLATAGAPDRIRTCGLVIRRTRLTVQMVPDQGKHSSGRPERVLASACSALAAWTESWTEELAVITWSIF